MKGGGGSGKPAGLRTTVHAGADDRVAFVRERERLLRSLATVLAVPDHGELAGLLRRAHREDDGALVALVAAELPLAGCEPDDIARLDRYVSRLRLERDDAGLDVEHLFLVAVAVVAEAEAVARREFVVVEREIGRAEGVGQWPFHVGGAHPPFRVRDGHLLHERCDGSGRQIAAGCGSFRWGRRDRMAMSGPFDGTIRVAEIVDAEPFPEARKPELVKLTLDVGDEQLRSAAQLGYHHDVAELPGRQVLCATDLGTVNIAGYVSEALTVGVPDDDGNPVLVTPDEDVPLGGELY